MQKQSENTKFKHRRLLSSWCPFMSDTGKKRKIDALKLTIAQGIVEKDPTKFYRNKALWHCLTICDSESCHPPISPANLAVDFCHPLFPTCSWTRTCCNSSCSSLAEFWDGVKVQLARSQCYEYLKMGLMEIQADTRKKTAVKFLVSHSRVERKD